VLVVFGGERLEFHTSSLATALATRGKAGISSRTRTCHTATNAVAAIFADAGTVTIAYHSQTPQARDRPGATQDRRVRIVERGGRHQCGLRLERFEAFAVSLRHIRSHLRKPRVGAHPVVPD